MMNNMMNEGNFPILQPVSDIDIKGHIINIEDEGIIFAKKFFSVNGFFCAEGAKINTKVLSDIPRVPYLSHRFYCSSGYSDNDDVYFKIYTETENDYNRNSSQYGHDVYCKTIPSQKFKGALSYKEGETEFEPWMRKTKEDAKEEANKAERERNEKVAKINEERKKEILTEYKRWVGNVKLKYIRSWLGKKFGGSSSRWVDEWLRTHKVDTSEVESAFDMLLAKEERYVIFTPDDIKILNQDD